MPSNKYRLAPLLSFSVWRINHFHNYKFWGAPWVNGLRHKYSSLLLLSCLLPRPLKDYFGLFPAPLAEAEELVSSAASFGKKLVATGLQLSVALGQAGVCPPQVLHDRCVHGVMSWKLPNKALELLW